MCNHRFAKAGLWLRTFLKENDEGDNRVYYILGSIYTFTIISEIVCIIILLLKGERNLKTYLFLGCIASSLLWGMSQIGIFGESNEIQF